MSTTHNILYIILILITTITSLIIIHADNLPNNIFHKSLYTITIIGWSLHFIKILASTLDQLPALHLIPLYPIIRFYTLPTIKNYPDNTQT